ncbi:2831_t:CDS:10 [Entrophospora sp. SA101]|nr:2831_t:CDS:10 [Entrophospora sp. SA101]
MAILKLPFFSKQPEVKPWSFPEEKHERITDYLYGREVNLNSPYIPRDYSKYVSSKIPQLIQESEINMENHDKIFSSHWISYDEIVIGTKYNGNCSGIRSIAVNPSKTLLAVGAGKPYQVTIYELPSFDPVAVFAGHNDLVFSVEWLDDDHVVSGSRDGTIRLWSIQSKIVSELPILPNKYINVHQSLLTRSGNIGKVRDLKYNPKTEQIMTLSTAGYVKIWDSSYLNRIAKIQLNHTNENVCLSMNPKLSLYAVGSQSHVSILDPRISSSIVHEIDSVDEGWEIGSGWLNRDAVYINHFSGSSIQNAIYTLSYDESGTKLFSGGGPLHLGLKGSYAALWA